MSNLQKEFVPYEIALKFKELGFDEPCFGWYLPEIVNKGNISTVILGSYMTKWNKFGNRLSAPLYQQAFRWFREKYGLYHSIGLDDSLENNINCDYQIINHSQSISELDTDFKSYEEAELECLKKLIELCKTN